MVHLGQGGQSGEHRWLRAALTSSGARRGRWREGRWDGSRSRLHWLRYGGSRARSRALKLETSNSLWWRWGRNAVFDGKLETDDRIHGLTGPYLALSDEWWGGRGERTLRTDVDTTRGMGFTGWGWR